jgi:hypothetical protein
MKGERLVYDMGQWEGRFCVRGNDCYTDPCCLCRVADLQSQTQIKQRPWVPPRPDSSVVERGPEKAGVGGSIPSLATT